ncbi:MAG: hypothetical protein A2Y12_03530 [Planctomycetes bacterium GWF2_42_9]|nr:MAG: hypothetical protein A2Y12_03530 [Planctomycetes bacterium GWF2_42_9]
MKKTAYLSDAQIAHIMSLPPLSEALPYVFQNGSVLGGIVFACTTCGVEFAPENVKGTITPTNTHAALLTSYGLCYGCKLAQPCNCRLADDGSFLVQGPDGWIKKRYAAEPEKSLLSRVKTFLLTGGLK